MDQVKKIDVKTTRKRRFGDRHDGRRLRSLDPFTRIIPYIMKYKNGAKNQFAGSLEIVNAEKYIRELRGKGMKGLGMLHIFIAAYVRIVSQRPAINRFISGQKYYARNDIQINMAVKKQMRLDGQETTIKVTFDPTDTIYDVYNRVTEAVNQAKSEFEENNTDYAAKLFNLLPGFVLRFTIWLIEILDYINLLPRWVSNVSPFHGSIFISDLGSIGLPPVYHHLYDFGNIPIFFCFGPKYKKYELDREGNPKLKRLIDYTVVLDERICDGFYFSSVLKMLNYIFSKPEVLSVPPETVVEDID